MTDSFHFFVRGTPISQGSMSVFMIGGKPVICDQKSKSLKFWREAVRADGMANKLNNSGVGFFSNVEIQCVFHMGHMPKSYFTKNGGKRKSYRPYPNVKPDLDKLVRAVLDALTGVFYKDDAQVIKIVAEKAWGTNQEGVMIHVLDRAFSGMEFRKDENEYK